MASKFLRRWKYDGIWYRDGISTSTDGMKVVIVGDQEGGRGDMNVAERREATMVGVPAGCDVLNCPGKEANQSRNKQARKPGENRAARSKERK